MLDRFQGDGGRRLLIETLKDQKIVAGESELAESMADKVELLEMKPGETLISQGASDNFLLLILSGVVKILVNGHLVNRRVINDHVGEIAAIDPSQRRTATVEVEEGGVVAKLTEQNLSEIGMQHPGIYRRIAKELARRLFQRNALIGKARPRIKLFVISSVEALPVARILQTSFKHDQFVTTVWTDGVFRAGSTALHSLMEAVEDSDFAVAIAHADDMATVRRVEWPAPRDNVVFELGLFIGRLGKNRAILMEPRDRDVKLPSDMAGIATITYQFEAGADAAALMAPACNELRDLIHLHGPNL